MLSYIYIVNNKIKNSNTKRLISTQIQQFLCQSQSQSQLRLSLIQELCYDIHYYDLLTWLQFSNHSFTKIYKQFAVDYTRSVWYLNEQAISLSEKSPSQFVFDLIQIVSHDHCKEFLFVASQRIFSYIITCLQQSLSERFFIGELSHSNNLQSKKQKQLKFHALVSSNKCSITIKKQLRIFSISQLGHDQTHSYFTITIFLDIIHKHCICTISR